MGRPPLPVGTFGQIHFLRLDKHRVAARTYFRDLDGRRRLVTRYGQTRAQAERRLREALRDRSTGATPPVPADSRLSDMAALWPTSTAATGPPAPSGCTASSPTPTSSRRSVSCACGRSPSQPSTVCSPRCTAPTAPRRPRPLAASSQASSGSPSGTDCSPPTRSARHLPAEGRATPAAVLERSPSRRHTSCGPGWPMIPPRSARTCPTSSPSCSAPGCARRGLRCPPDRPRRRCGHAHRRRHGGPRPTPRPVHPGAAQDRRRPAHHRAATTDLEPSAAAPGSAAHGGGPTGVVPQPEGSSPRSEQHQRRPAPGTGPRRLPLGHVAHLPPDRGHPPR